MAWHSSQVKETKETSIDLNVLSSIIIHGGYGGQVVLLVHSSVSQETH